MRFVFTSDTHFPFTPDQIPQGDVFVHVGDLMYSGYVNEWYPLLESLKALKFKEKILCPGNHDFHIQNYEGVAHAELRRAGVRMLGTSRHTHDIGGLRIAALPFVTGLPGWAYNRDDEWIREYMKEAITPFKPDIIISHAPPYQIQDAIRPDALRVRDQEHVGCMAYNHWFYNTEHRPKLWVSGHIHESYGKTVIDDTTFFNVAMCDRKYEQVNPPMVVDL